MMWCSDTRHKTSFSHFPYPYSTYPLNLITETESAGQDTGPAPESVKVCAYVHARLLFVH